MFLSILIPVYRDACLSQVEQLRDQCEALEPEGLEWEIVVGDDGTPPDESQAYQPIAHMAGCRLLRRESNYGRSSARNYLARMARYDYLLYQDAGVEPAANLVATYLQHMGRADVVCGSVRVAPSAVDRWSLRCRYEQEAETRLSAAHRNKHPYRSFRTTNFMIRRAVMIEHPLREDIRGYGFEDVLLGRELAESGVSVLHIDNPVYYVSLETNDQYLRKIAESIDTLAAHRAELRDYSGVLDLAERLRRWHLLWLVSLSWRLLSRPTMRNLRGHHPFLHLFGYYRLALLTSKLNADKQE